MILSNSNPEEFTFIWQSKLVGKIVIEIERTWISFLSDVFVDFAVVVLLPIEKLTFTTKCPSSRLWNLSKRFLLSQKLVLNWFSTILRNFPLFFSSSQTASLPGRIDQINHLLRPGSPQNRPISPISILRDSRPVSPLVFNSNHTSPTPSPSPERDPYPPTPPIRYQDFSPVKSEDDTGIHSGSSESDHEVIGKGQ